MLRSLLTLSTLLIVVPGASAAEPCGVDKAWAKQCRALSKKAAKLCEPERMYLTSKKDRALWLDAVAGGASTFEKELNAFAQSRPACLTEKTSKNCAMTQSLLDRCKALPKKFETAWIQVQEKQRKEALDHITRLEKRAKEDPKEVWSYYVNAKRYMAKTIGVILGIEPTNREFLGYKTRMKAVAKPIIAANLDRLEKVRCPKPRVANAKLSKTLTKVYNGYLGALTNKAKVRQLGLEKALIKETDTSGTKWEYAYVTSCVEVLIDKKDPARCAVQEVSFKRSKAPKKKWTSWSMRAHGARDDAMLCKNLGK